MYLDKNMRASVRTQLTHTRKMQRIEYYIYNMYIYMYLNTHLQRSDSIEPFPALPTHVLLAAVRQQVVQQTVPVVEHLPALRTLEPLQRFLLTVQTFLRIRIFIGRRFGSYFRRFRHHIFGKVRIFISDVIVLKNTLKNFLCNRNSIKIIFTPQIKMFYVIACQSESTLPNKKHESAFQEWKQAD